ncbi:MULTISPECIES: hypothetical protein [Vreelandella]|uniref:DUF2384 domain-containing protein n=1 Tax=Vreelandella titanicae TaxID=664683 RepID=A0A558J183_9GAMM|nr:hypothetical protein [Halomonas titanicae]TVU87350.1 hypothetical protein FQP89_22495 [Halomonas titanicae]
MCPDDTFDVKLVAGNQTEVITQVRGSHADQFVVLEVGHLSVDAFTLLTTNMRTITTSMGSLLSQTHKKNNLELIVNAMLAEDVPTPIIMREAGMEARAKRTIIKSGYWANAADISKLAGYSVSNPSSQPNRWKKQGAIFAINFNGTDYYPTFALDENANYRPYKAMMDIIAIFKGHKSEWGMAFWFQSINSFLGGKRPQNLLASDPGRVIEAALDEIQGVLHG